MSVIGEAYQAITITWGVWTWCKDGKGRIHDSYRVVSKTKAHLELLKHDFQGVDRKKQPETYVDLNTLP